MTSQVGNAASHESRRSLVRSPEEEIQQILQLDQTAFAFDRAGRLDIARHKKVNGQLGLSAHGGDGVEKVIAGNVVGTSNAAHRLSVARDLRFDQEYVFAGEGQACQSQTSLSSAR